MLLLLMILALAQHQMEVAVSFAMGQGRPPRFQIAGDEATLAQKREDIHKQIFDAFMAASDDHRADMFADPRFYGTHSRIYLSTRYVMEFALHQWLLLQNCEVGVAPLAALVFATVLRFIPSGAPAFAQDRLRQMLQDGAVAAHRWLRIFRHRWDAAAGKRLGTTAPVSLAEMQDKAAAFLESEGVKADICPEATIP